jgi:amidase
VFEINPKYPDPTLAFVPQFFGGIREEADAVEHFDLLERRTRQTYRMGGWARPGVLEWALRQTEKVSAKANRVFDRCDVLMTPTIAHRPPSVGILDGIGTVRSALRAMPAIAYAALWNVAGNPAASVPAGVAADGLPTAVQLVGRTDDEATLLSLAAQIERARPWPLFAPTRRD